MWSIVLKSIALVVAGVILLRIAGRKSISQMTIPQLAILLSIGSILGSEVGGKGLFYSILGTSIFIAFLVLMEWITLKWNTAESLLKGKAVLVISEGEMNLSAMAKLRLTQEDLKKRLRMVGISSFEDVKSATIEANGELGYELMPHARPVTMGELDKLMKTYFQDKPLPVIQSQPQNNLFANLDDEYIH
ncbi:DUF421 domain-containing protein [Paenibacillus ferrarius]|uniref:DUF421 domain-containing protein n=1 Tax=Paenibacillus ferrarius TaxID=1469647 RepID=UPI003D2D43A9